MEERRSKMAITKEHLAVEEITVEVKPTWRLAWGLFWRMTLLQIAAIIVFSFLLGFLSGFLESL